MVQVVHKTIEQKCIIDLEILVQRLQHCLGLYEDSMSTENQMEDVDENNIKEEQDLQMKRLCDLVNFKISYSARRLKTSEQETYHGRYGGHYC